MSTLNQSSSLNSCTKFPIPPRDNHVVDEIQSQPFDYSKRAQWLRAAVLGANDGLISTASLMMGVGAVKHDVKAMILTGFAGLIAGACSMAIDFKNLRITIGETLSLELSKSVVNFEGW